MEPSETSGKGDSYLIWDAERMQDISKSIGTGKSIILFDKPSEDTNLEEFITKDSGQRVEFSTGMKRDVQTDKPRYDLIGSGWALIRRWAELMGRGAIKYGELNFEKAATEEELKRFKASGLRHMIQWFHGETDEDHAAAVCFNIAGAEMVKRKLGEVQK